MTCQSASTANETAWRADQTWIWVVRRCFHLFDILKRISIQQSWEMNLTGPHEQQVKTTMATSSASAGAISWGCLHLTAATCCTPAMQQMTVLPLMLWHCLCLCPTTSLPSWACLWNFHICWCLGCLHFTRGLPVWCIPTLVFQVL